METKLQEFFEYFKKTNGTGLLVLNDISVEPDVKSRIEKAGFNTVSNISNLQQQTGTYVLYFKKDDLKYIYSVYKQISDGLSMIQYKHPQTVSDEIIHIDTMDFRFLLVITEEDLKYAQNVSGFDFINLAGMIEYINK